MGRGWGQLPHHVGLTHALSLSPTEQVQALPVVFISSPSHLTAEWAKKVALLKRNCFAAVFMEFFDIQAKGGDSKQGIVDYRDQETMYISAKKDRVTVIFSTIFQDDDDVIIGKVFMQEFKEGRRGSQTAPQVCLCG